MADCVFLRLHHLREGACVIEEKRIVAKAAFTFFGMTYFPATFSMYRNHVICRNTVFFTQCSRRAIRFGHAYWLGCRENHRNHAHKRGAAFFVWYVCHIFEKQCAVGCIVPVSAGITRGIDSRRAVQCVHGKSGIVR